MISVPSPARLGPLPASYVTKNTVKFSWYRRNHGTRVDIFIYSRLPFNSTRFAGRRHPDGKRHGELRGKEPSSRLRKIALNRKRESNNLKGIVAPNGRVSLWRVPNEAWRNLPGKLETKRVTKGQMKKTSSLRRGDNDTPPSTPLDINTHPRRSLPIVPPRCSSSFVSFFRLSLFLSLFLRTLFDARF